MSFVPDSSYHIRLSRLAPAAREKARAFLETAAEFHLGALPTEQSHPQTKALSQLAKSDLPGAIRLFQTVEREAYEKLRAKSAGLEALSSAIRDTLDSGHRIYLCGCGATGRLSLALETLWRSRWPEGDPSRERVVAFMAGADFALVRSIENFEDHPEYGERQLEDLGFRDGDLLLAVTEGGETPFVIGAAEHAAKAVAKGNDGRRPWFVYCNPDEILSRTAERSRRVLENPRIEKLNLSVGPMAITGSTRLQATSVQMFAVGSALFFASGLGPKPMDELEKVLALIGSPDLGALAPLIEAESAVYERGEYCLHASREHAISVFTDVTERSPTFSLPAFENSLAEEWPPTRPAWTYLEVPGAASAAEAWASILLRSPRALTWEGFGEKYGPEILAGFDFSDGASLRRQAYLGTRAQHRFEIARDGNEIAFRFQGREARFNRGLSPLAEALFVKLLLNVSSTLVMGRLGRFEGNVMLWVKSSNNKLIDRSIRYVQELLEAEGFKPPPYTEIAIELFEILESLRPDEPAVIATRDRLLQRLKG